MNKAFKIISFISFALILSHTKSMSQNTAEEITNKFFELFPKSANTAVDYIFSTNKLITDKKSDIINLGNKLNDLTSSIGEFYGYEPLFEKYAGKNYKMVTFIVRYAKEPLRFTFILYKPKDTWQLNSFSFDEKIDEDLEQASKMGFYISGSNYK